MAHIEFFFDLSSPWTRLAFQNIQPIVEETRATIAWRPFLVGGVFNAVNDSVYAGRADPSSPKNRNTFKWLKDWARVAGVPMNFPSRHHPLKSVNAMRFCCAIEDDQDALFRFSNQAFDAYFGEKRNLDAIEVLVEIADACGLDGADLARRAQDDDVKLRLRANTQEVIDRGGFGSPTIFVDRTELFFGNDQLPIVRQAILEADL
ncbi:2-hydroxychromene-2-carboxylate isomerase [Caulobacter sp. SSI4214]|uniref:2-hydroxychromene-2-carboxylate isomerase n=1 Tax=Caulobacter sp. SSI4214 TaxID=2575739 RepID=UPI001439C320|nr:2-hydroxychromene-2-carboxylate isomerase [Caulobacter sp. SSI4214]